MVCMAYVPSQPSVPVQLCPRRNGLQGGGWTCTIPTVFAFSAIWPQLFFCSFFWNFLFFAIFFFCNFRGQVLTAGKDDLSQLNAGWARHEEANARALGFTNWSRCFGKMDTVRVHGHAPLESYGKHLDRGQRGSVGACRGGDFAYFLCYVPSSRCAIIVP